MVVHLMVGTFSVPGMVDQTKISELMDTLYNLAIACGLLAQLPMVTMMLTAIGLVTPGFLLKQWRIAVVIIFIVTAAITPGDVISAQVLLGVPMVALYFLSVGLSYFVAKKQKESEAMVLSDEPRDEPEDREDD
jgi:sec-independent protein translocase protein TatC